MKRILVAVLILALVLIAAAKLFVLEIPVIAGDDMAPSVQRGDRLLANRLLTPPRRGDLVLVEHPQSTRLLVRRVVGLPGETVSVKREVPIVDGRPAERHVGEEVSLAGAQGDAGRPMRLVEETLEGVRYQVLKDPRRRSNDVKPVALEGAYFVMSDNRNHGTDSRNFGPIPKDKVRAVITHRLSAGPGSLAGQEAREGWASLR